jgi:putative transposase
VGRNRLSLYVHLVWATWDRLPMIGSGLERVIQRVVVPEAQEMGCAVLAIGGVEDRMHLLVTLPATGTVAALVKQMKGESSRAADDRAAWAGVQAAGELWCLQRER